MRRRKGVCRMNLIDADKLIEKIDRYTRTNNVEFNIACKYIIEVVKEQPTAFDVKKVVSELEDYKMWKELLIYDLDFRERQIIKKAIEMVKAGGIDE